MYACCLDVFVFDQFLHLPLQIPPLRVRRHWFQLGEEYIHQLADDQISMQLSNKNESSKHTSKNPYSEFENRFGRYADPLFSKLQPDPLRSGLDPDDNEFVFVDAHVLATPTLADTDGDGEANELVVPVSYYFDPFVYGDQKFVETTLGGLEQNELVDYVAGGIIIIDLKTRKILRQKMLGITRASSDQPGYLLATPTVVKIARGDTNAMIIIGSATGDLHLLNAKYLSEATGFPQSLDSVSSQVAVADLFRTGQLNIVVGDHSGNVYCLDKHGKRIWEQEVNVQILASIRFGDLENDGNLEVILTTQGGDLWILNGQDGTPYPPNYPLHLNVGVHSPVLLLHLNSSSQDAHTGGKRLNALSIVMSTSEAIYIVDALTGCIYTFETQHMFMDILVDDIDPYSPGLELLALSLDGYMVCFSTQTSHSSDLQRAIESWPSDAIGQNSFTHKSNTFALVLPHANNTNRDISGSSFNLDLQLYHSTIHSPTMEYVIQVTVGRKYKLYSDIVTVNNKVNDIRLVIPTPPIPLRCFVTVKVCNTHVQCDTQSYYVNFNLNFEDNLKWFLALPFLFLCAFVLWSYRDAGTEALPTTATSSRKNL